MIRVRVFAALRELAGAGQFSVEGHSVGEVVDATIAAVPAEHTERFGQIASVSSFVVNGERASRETPIADGDEVAILPPVSGGGVGGRTVLLLGAGEFEPWSEAAERAALVRARSGDGSVAILPTASAPEGQHVFERWARMGLDHYADLGIPARLVPLMSRQDAAREELIEQVALASMIFFSGGRPSYLSATLRGTPFWTAVLAALDRGAVFAGCSAGAMVAGAARRGRRRRFDPWGSGLEVVPGLIAGVHWDAVPRALFPVRDIVARMAPREADFLGIDEHTAALGDADGWEVFGFGSIHVGVGRRARSYGAGERFTLPNAAARR
ncbi:MAG: MoaD family protein [Actinomycetota bacterium]